MQYIAMYIHVHLTLLQGLLAWHMLCVVYRAAHLLKVSVQFLTEASELPSSTVVKTKHIGQQVWEELVEILQRGGITSRLGRNVQRGGACVCAVFPLKVGERSPL